MVPTTMIHTAPATTMTFTAPATTMTLTVPTKTTLTVPLIETRTPMGLPTTVHPTMMTLMVHLIEAVVINTVVTTITKFLDIFDKKNMLLCLDLSTNILCMSCGYVSTGK